MTIKHFEYYWNVLDLRDAFWSIRLDDMDQHMSDDPSTDEETKARNEQEKQQREERERQYRSGNIPESAVATAMAIAMNVAMAPAHPNKVVERDTRQKRKKKTKKIYNKCSPFTQPSKDNNHKPDDDKPPNKPVLVFKRMTTVKQH